MISYRETLPAMQKVRKLKDALWTSKVIAQFIFNSFSFSFLPKIHCYQLKRFKNEEKEDGEENVECDNPNKSSYLHNMEAWSNVGAITLSFQIYTFR